jgi:hypothetical protein
LGPAAGDLVEWGGEDGKGERKLDLFFVHILQEQGESLAFAHRSEELRRGARFLVALAFPVIAAETVHNGTDGSLSLGDSEVRSQT